MLFLENGMLVWLALLGCEAEPDPGPPLEASGPCFQGWGPDEDGDGFTAYHRVYACVPPGDGWTSATGDCDDDDARRRPDAPEVCDADDVDEDCDGAGDDLDREQATDVVTWYRDRDGDGWGDPGRPEVSCDRPEGHIDRSGDCVDGNPDVHPEATDPCPTDGVDEDCDGHATLFLDEDGDGYGAEPASCDQAGAPLSGDCDDALVGLNPGATEICGDGVDQDCSGHAGACGIEGRWYVDDGTLPQLEGAQVRAGDVDGDGLTDVLTGITGSNTFGLALYLGPFDVTPPATLTVAGSNELHGGWLADLDGDGRDEVLVNESMPDLVLWADAAARSGRIEAGSATHILRGAWRVDAVLDSDGDGADEIVTWVEAADARVSMLLGGFGVGRWDAADLALATLSDADRVAALGDVDGDGLPDLAWSSHLGVAVAHGPVRGALATGDADWQIAAGGSPSSTGDLDGDGRDDLAVTVTTRASTERGHCPEPDRSTVHVLTAPLPSDLLDADATIEGSPLQATGAHGDFDGDGGEELVLVATHSCDALSTAAFAVAGPFAGDMDLRKAARIDGSPYGHEPFGSAVAADLDGDGTDDLALGGYERTWLFFGGPGL